MAIRIRLGRRRSGDSGKGSDALGIGIAIALLAASEGHDDLLAIAVVMTASGVWIARLHRVVAGRAPPLAIVGGLFAGWSLVGGIAAAYHREWYLALACPRSGEHRGQMSE